MRPVDSGPGRYGHLGAVLAMVRAAARWIEERRTTTGVRTMNVRPVELSERIVNRTRLPSLNAEISGPSPADCPELEFEPGKVASHGQGQAAVALDLLPQLAAAVKLEVVETGVEWQLSGGDRQ